MTKISTLVLAGMLSLGLSACSGSETANTAAEHVTNTSVASEDANLSVVDEASLGDNAAVADPALGNELGNAGDANTLDATTTSDANASGNAL